MEQFLQLIRRQTNISELTPTKLHELIERIEVHAPDKSSGERVQDITVHYSYIGAIMKTDIFNPGTAGLAEIKLVSPQADFANQPNVFNLC